MRWKLKDVLFVAGVTAVICSVIVQTSSADVLYDTTWMTDDGTWTVPGVPSQIAAYQTDNPNALIDVNAADDFVLSSSATLTSVTGDFYSNGTFGGEGLLIEFFGDNDGTPSGVATEAVFVTLDNGLSIEPFSTGFPDFPGMRLVADLSSADITLGPGTWWISIVAVHEQTPSQIYRWLRKVGFQNGLELHVRNGGKAHGNGYQGTWGTDDWTPISNFGSNKPGDVAMKIEGTIDQGNPADLDGSGAVDVNDLLILLGNWGTDGVGAGLADPNDIVDVADLLVLLSAWR